MTNKEKPEIITFAEALDRIAKDGGARNKVNHPRPDVKSEAIETLRKNAYNLAKEIDPNYQKSIGQMTSDEIKGYSDMRQKTQFEDVSKFLYDKRQEIINKQLPQKGLEKLLEDEKAGEAILSNASKEDREKISTLANYRGLEDTIKRYAETGRATKEEREQIIGLASEGAAEEQKRVLREKGYSLEVQELGASLASLAVRTGGYKEEKIKEYALVGLGKGLEKIKGTLGKDPAAPIRESLLRMIESEDPETYQMAINLTNRAYRAAA